MSLEKSDIVIIEHNDNNDNFDEKRAAIDIEALELEKKCLIRQFELISERNKIIEEIKEYQNKLGVSIGEKGIQEEVKALTERKEKLQKEYELKLQKTKLAWEIEVMKNKVKNIGTQFVSKTPGEIDLEDKVVVQTVKKLLTCLENLTGKSNKILVTNTMCDLFINIPGFLERHEKFKEVVRNKLVEFIRSGELPDANKYYEEIFGEKFDYQNDAQTQKRLQEEKRDRVGFLNTFKNLFN